MYALYFTWNAFFHWCLGRIEAINIKVMVPYCFQEHSPSLLWQFFLWQQTRKAYFSDMIIAIQCTLDLYFYVGCTQRHLKHKLLCFFLSFKLKSANTLEPLSTFKKVLCPQNNTDPHVQQIYAWHKINV